jgi:hypothetical protein
MQQEEESSLMEYGEEELKRGEVRPPRVPSSTPPQVDNDPKIIF